MFSNFLYFIVALLLYTTCQFPESENVMPDHALLLFILLTGGFAITCRMVFNRLERRAWGIMAALMEQRLDRAILRLSIGALFVFA